MHKKRPDHHGRRAAPSVRRGDRGRGPALLRRGGGARSAGGAGRRAAPAAAARRVRVVPVRVVVPCGWAPPEPEPTPEPEDGGAPEQAAEPPPPPPLGARARLRRKGRRRGVPGPGDVALGPRGLGTGAARGGPPASPCRARRWRRTRRRRHRPLEATVDVRVETREGEGAAVVDLGACRLRVRDVVDAATLGRPRVDASRSSPTQAPPARAMPTPPPGRCSVSRSPSTTSSRTTSTGLAC